LERFELAIGLKSEGKMNIEYVFFINKSHRNGENVNILAQGIYFPLLTDFVIVELDFS
jgi:hypothetical protein